MITMVALTLTFTVVAVGILLYLAYREAEIDLPPRRSTHHRAAAHHR
jgi:hypothetical protein